MFRVFCFLRGRQSVIGEGELQDVARSLAEAIDTRICVFLNRTVSSTGGTPPIILRDIFAEKAEKYREGVGLVYRDSATIPLVVYYSGHEEQLSFLDLFIGLVDVAE